MDIELSTQTQTQTQEKTQTQTQMNKHAHFVTFQIWKSSIRHKCWENQYILREPINIERTNMYICTYGRTQTQTHTRTHVHSLAPVQVVHRQQLYAKYDTHTHTQIHICTHTHTHIHLHTHTHTHPQPQPHTHTLTCAYWSRSSPTTACTTWLSQICSSAHKSPRHLCMGLIFSSKVSFLVNLYGSI